MCRQCVRILLSWFCVIPILGYHHDIELPLVVCLMIAVKYSISIYRKINTMYTTVGPYSYKLFFAVICYKTEYSDITVFFAILFRCVKYDCTPLQYICPYIFRGGSRIFEWMEHRWRRRFSRLKSLSQSLQVSR